MDNRRKERAGAREALGRAMSPFSVRAFRILWTGNAVSAAGTGMTRVALVFSVLAVNGSVTDIGLVMAGQVGTQVVFTLVGGVWADRLRRELVMLTSDLVRAAAQVVLAVLILTGHAQVWHLVAGSIVFGAAQAFFGPASSGLMAEIVPPAQLQRALAAAMIVIPCGLTAFVPGIRAVRRLPDGRIVGPQPKVTTAPAPVPVAD